MICFGLRSALAHGDLPPRIGCAYSAKLNSGSVPNESTTRTLHLLQATMNVNVYSIICTDKKYSISWVYMSLRISVLFFLLNNHTIIQI